jgi:hypothetical protein
MAMIDLDQVRAIDVHTHAEISADGHDPIAEAGVPALFHTGHSGIGAGLPGGDGIRLKYSNPMYVDDVAVDFPSSRSCSRTRRFRGRTRRSRSLCTSRRCSSTSPGGRFGLPDDHAGPLAAR